MKTRLFKLAVVLAPMLFGLGGVEVYFRLFRQRAYWTAAELQSTNPNRKLQHRFDARLGFRPALGTDEYTAFGTHPNDFPLAKQPGRERLLFLGDSVTNRGRIVEALGDFDAADKREYWNAGVEAFNATQIVKCYELFNHRVQPDHVVLTFHNNDFQAQPVVETDDEGFTIYSALQPYRVRMPWLLRRAETVRRLVVRRWKHARRRTAVADVRAALERLKQRLDAEGVRFSIVLLPILRPFDEWTPEERDSRRHALGIFEEIEIPCFDLRDSLEQALADGVEVCETPGDIWHPSPAAAARFAQELVQQGLLDGRPPSERPNLQPVAN